MTRTVIQTRKLEFIQALRGLASLLVVMSHLTGSLQFTPFEQDGKTFLWPGVDGVDLFFLISGFIMVYSTRADRGGVASVRTFLARRIARVWPIYVLASVVYLLAFSRTFPSQDDALRLLKSIFFIPPNLQAMAPYFGPPTLFVGWTLNFEAFFYLLFAVSLFFGRLRYVVLALFGVGLCLLVPIFTLGLSMNSGANPEHHIAYLNLATNPMALEFFIGAAIGLIFLSPLRFASRTMANAFILTAAAFSIWGHFSIVYHGNGPGHAGVFYAVLLLVLLIASKSQEIVVPRWSVRLGDLSYSLYLTHPMSLSLLERIFNALGWGALTHDWSYVLLATAFCVSVAALVWAYIEVPLEKAARRVLLPNPGKEPVSTRAAA